MKTFYDHRNLAVEPDYVKDLFWLRDMTKKNYANRKKYVNHNK